MGSRRSPSRPNALGTPCSASTRGDRLDPELVAVGVDVVDHLLPVGRSSSAAKKADAVLRIAFARRSSGFSLSHALIRFRSKVVVPLQRRGPRPAPAST